MLSRTASSSILPAPGSVSKAMANVVSIPCMGRI